jgi:hypothetical protein
MPTTSARPISARLRMAVWRVDEKMNLPDPTDHQELFEFVVSLLNEATPRAMIIIGAARLEEETKNIVRLVAPGFEADHRSHGMRLELLAALSILSESTKDCLKHISKIRNHFAHSSGKCALDDIEIRQNVAALFSTLERFDKFSQLTDNFFNDLLAKVKAPQSLLSPTWLDQNYKKFHIAVSLLDHHLRIVRCNLPTPPQPIELNQWSKGFGAAAP